MLAPLPWKHIKVFFNYFLSLISINIHETLYIYHLSYEKYVVYKCLRVKEIIQNGCHGNGSMNFRIFHKGLTAKYRMTPYPNYFGKDSNKIQMMFGGFVDFGNISLLQSPIVIFQYIYL